jgi:phenylacetate-CoA ligase
MNQRLARLYYDAVQRARGLDYRTWLRRLEELQWAPAQDVEELRLQRLRSLVAHCAAHVPFYRETFRQLDLAPADIKSTHELRLLPKIDKASLRAGYSRFFAQSGAGAYETWTSSGSTGEPFPFRLGKESIAMNTFAAMIRGRKWWGLDVGLREGMIWSGVRSVGGHWSARMAAIRRRLSWRLKNIVLVDVYHLDPAAIRKAYEDFLAFRPAFLRTIASGLYRFCAGLDALGLDGTALGIRAAIFTGEGLRPAQRQLVERVLGCKTVSEYGCTELGAIAFECPSGNLHLSHENLVVEFEKDGRQAQPGEQADLVITNLNDRAAPLVRYAIGDVVTVPADARCPCGRTMPIIGGVMGRTHDTIVTPDGQLVHALYFTHIFDALPSIHQFRVVQERIDHLRIELRSSQAIPSRDKEFVHFASAQAMGPGVKIEVVEVPELPVSSGGKQPWIVSKVDASRQAPA